jgi:hypothetical protein
VRALYGRLLRIWAGSARLLVCTPWVLTISALCALSRCVSFDTLRLVLLWVCVGGSVVLAGLLLLGGLHFDQLAVVLALLFHVSRFPFHVSRFPFPVSH